MNETRIFDIIQTLILAIGMLWIQRTAKKRDDKREKKDAADNAYKRFVTKGIDGNSSLGLQLAKWFKKLHPEVNGDLAVAQKRVEDNQHELSNFLTDQGLENILNN